MVSLFKSCGVFHDVCCSAQGARPLLAPGVRVALAPRSAPRFMAGFHLSRVCPKGGARGNEGAGHSQRQTPGSGRTPARNLSEPESGKVSEAVLNAPLCSSLPLTAGAGISLGNWYPGYRFQGTSIAASIAGRDTECFV